MKFEELRAKSRPPLRLQQHLADVHLAAQRVLDATQDDQLRALGLLPEDYRDRLRRIVLLGAAVHDLGKANDHFQGMIWETRDVRTQPQGLRHEWVSLLMLHGMREWLLPAVEGKETDFAVLEWAVAGHHPAFDHASPPRVNPPGAGVEIGFLIGHDDFRAALTWLQTTFGLSSSRPLATRMGKLVGGDNVFAQIGAWFRKSQQVWEKLRNTPEARLAAAAKNALIAADVAGSALPKAMPNDAARWGWITDAFAAKPEPGDLRTVVAQRSKSFTEKDEARERFQAAVAASTSPVTFVKAGCGTGKTLTAYMWAAANFPTRRLYFCYPTTGTATEGFKDYLFEPEGELGGIGAKLFHSRRDVDFEIILTTGKDTKSPEADAAARLESLEAWSTPIVACTVDTVLGLVQNNRRGLYAWPALAQSAFVFDEIHAYDDRLFGALLRFLRDLPGLPALLMTASLPKPREEALRETLKKFRGLDLNMIHGPASLETSPRYYKLAVPNNDPLPEIQKALGENGKVLWVCNTVRRVMDAAERAEALGLEPLIYHSRFKYEDRVKRHKAVVEAFTSGNHQLALALCSQVAEMSLDLKGCTLLVTDLATVPAMIQRLGRLNRQAKAGDPTRPCIVIEPENHLPYTPADLEAARTWLGRLPDRDICQRDLADRWEQTAETPPELVPSAWLDGGPSTPVTELREASPGVSVLMEMDVPAVQERPKLLGRFVLPMPPPPRSMDWRAWKKERGLPVAPPGTIDYDANRGAEWRR
jgi:CRISPR-associated endonuclease/helicase Cas3